jgi:hypothetical protein
LLRLLLVASDDVRVQSMSGVLVVCPDGRGMRRSRFWPGVFDACIAKGSVDSRRYEDVLPPGAYDQKFSRIENGLRWALIPFQMNLPMHGNPGNFGSYAPGAVWLDKKERVIPEARCFPSVLSH